MTHKEALIKEIARYLPRDFLYQAENAGLDTICANVIFDLCATYQDDEYKAKIIEAVNSVSNLSMHRHIQDKIMSAIEKVDLSAAHQDEWISVSDRLPADCDLVYFCTDSGGVGFGQLDEHGICTVNYFPLRALGKVILWQPLPQPPTSKNDE